MYHENRMKMEKQFKEEMGFSITEGEIKLRGIRRKSDELYSLRCSLNGFCSTTNEKIILSVDERKIVQARIGELEH